MKRLLAALALICLSVPAFAQFPVNPLLPSSRCVSAISGIMIIKLIENRDISVPQDGISDNQFSFWRSGKQTIATGVDHPANYSSTGMSGSYTGTGTCGVTRCRAMMTLAPYPSTPGWYVMTVKAYSLSTGILIYPLTTVYTQGILAFPATATAEASLRPPKKGRK